MIKKIKAFLLLGALISTSIVWSQESDLEKELEQMLEKSEKKEKASPYNFSPSIPDILVAGDFLGSLNLHGAEQPDVNDNFDLRELEFGFSGDIDHWLSGVILFALHREPPGEEGAGEYKFDIHEAYVDFADIGWNFQSRIGMMFLDLGRLNRFHRHDWDFSNAPEIHQVITNDRQVKEGVKDIGAELAWLAPFPFFQEWKIGVFRGRTFGHTHSDGVKKPHPLYLARNKQFFHLGGGWGMQLGFSFIRYNLNKKNFDVDYTYGSDLMFRFVNSRKLGVNIGTEFWQKRRQTEGIKKHLITNGVYSYLLINLTRWHFGYRFDFVKNSDPRSDDQEHYLGNSLWIGFSPSEFSRFRFTVEQRNPKNYHGENRISWLGFGQITFILGAHPAHKY